MKKISIKPLLEKEFKKEKLNLENLMTKQRDFCTSNINNVLNISDYESLGLIVYKEFMIDGIVINKIL